MSISSEIQRLNDAKVRLRTSIEAKGVQVDSTITLDGFPDLVDQIPAEGAKEMVRITTYGSSNWCILGDGTFTELSYNDSEVSVPKGELCVFGVNNTMQHGQLSGTYDFQMQGMAYLDGQSYGCNALLFRPTGDCMLSWGS